MSVCVCVMYAISGSSRSINTTSIGCRASTAKSSFPAQLCRTFHPLFDCWKMQHNLKHPSPSPFVLHTTLRPSVGFSAPIETCTSPLPLFDGGLRFRFWSPTSRESGEPINECSIC
ncbi:hypothetical protein F5X97DRAFT_294431 [Nemania serpens]|nr:hypothetical protein F5X97DRAFT_294431 [Nemania serpens]